MTISRTSHSVLVVEGHRTTTPDARKAARWLRRNLRRSQPYHMGAAFQNLFCDTGKSVASCKIEDLRWTHQLEARCAFLANGLQ